MLLANLDLLSVGVTVAATLVLGASVYFTNSQNLSNRMFLCFSIVTACWGTVNFLSYQFSDQEVTLWLLRGIMFFAVFQAYFLYEFFSSFADPKRVFGRTHTYVLLPIVLLTATLTLTPYVFSEIQGSVLVGEVAEVQTGFGLVIFGLLAIGLIFAALIVLINKYKNAVGHTRKAIIIIFLGTLITFALIIFFNLIEATYFKNTRYIPLGALFMFPFVLFTAYAILREHLFNIKVIATAALIFSLSIVSILEILFANSLSLIVFRVSVFILVLIFGINLIRGVLREVEQREKIEKLAEDLEKSNEQLSEFMSLATHEIRNPATFIKGYTAGALEGDLGELAPNVRDGMQKLYVRANDIIHLGNQYLNKSKLELKQLNYDYVPVDLKKLTEDLVHEFEPAAAQQGITLHALFEQGSDYTVAADSGKLKEVIANLIDNSIKYTASGSVTVSAKRLPDAVQITVVDTGVGVPAEVIPKLFQKFSRADAQKANILGTGLGLYIAKIFVDAHHGTIKVDSDGKHGSTFTVELPVTQPVAQVVPH